MKPQEIRTLRKSLGLSVKQFAAALGFTGKHASVTVYRWETGARKPSIQTVKLMELLTKKKVA